MIQPKISKGPKVTKRKEAAEEVCWALMLMMDLGGLDIPMEWREELGKSMEEWVELAVQTGIMRTEEEAKGIL
jgi:hypothetical protein